ncbi:single-stranded DNA-binding protein [Spirosoma daeguense]
MQRIEIIGNIGQEATIKNHNGQEFITFSVAVNERYKNSEGIDVEKTNWYNCLYQPQKTTVAKFLLRGTKVFIEGKPKVSLYRDKDNQPRVDFGIQVRSIELLSAKPEESKIDSNQETKDTSNGTTETSSDDLPF